MGVVSSKTSLSKQHHIASEAGFHRSWYPVCLARDLPSGKAIGRDLLGTRVVRIETRLTDWLGRISYSIYLFHVIVIMAIEWWLLRRTPEGSPWRTQHVGVYTAIGVAVTLAVASLVYRFVEKPGIRLGHRLAERWQQRALRRLETAVPRA